PIYVAVLNRLAAFHVGKQGNRMMSVPYASVDRFDEVGTLAAEFGRGATEAGTAPDTLFTFHTHVAESDRACRRDAALRQEPDLRRHRAQRPRAVRLGRDRSRQARGASPHGCASRGGADEFR